MDSVVTHGFPAQQISFKQKGKKWRKQCVDFACDNTFLVSGVNRKSYLNKSINYNLFNGILDMKDLEVILNPANFSDDLVPQKIQHYPILNTKLQILKGEEIKRVFDYRVIVTDPNSISELSKTKHAEVLQSLQELVQDTSISDEEAQQKLQELSQYYTYTWQDMRELRANILLTHYNKENNFASLFNDGFLDAMICGEEMYLCDIVGGEPVLEKLDPAKVIVYQNSYSYKIEDADMIVIRDYWSPGKIVDHFYDVLTPQDRKYIENLNSSSGTADTDDMGNIHERNSYVYLGAKGKELIDKNQIAELFGVVNAGVNDSTYDINGNIRVIRVYWKSRRKIQKVTSYDPMTGEEVINFYPETYVPDTNMGEKSETLWINEAWEGTKIGDDVYVNIRPRPVQYNRLSNPSLCHFGIIGSLYGVNGYAPYSMVDMMKPWNYLYDVIHDRLNKSIAKNYGKLVSLDLALVPDGWEVDKWLYFARKDGIAVKDSYNEGKKGAATGKLAGALNNASSGVIDLDMGNIIQQYINLLEFCKLEMSEAVGISKQREGQISNRETVGGVERATLQSSHITEWIFTKHEDTKKRTLEAFIETAKIALKGRNKKFQYILPDFAQKIAEIDGDEFAESDYGLLVDSSPQAQELSQKMDGLVQMGLQNQMLTFSTALKMFTSCSLAEKMRMVENNEIQMQQQQQQAQQQQLEAQQQQAQMQAQQEQAKMELEDSLNERDNDTKLTIAMIQARTQQESQMLQAENTNNGDAKEALLEKMREFDLKLKLDKDRLAFDKDKADKDRQVKKEQIHARKTTTSK